MQSPLTSMHFLMRCTQLLKHQVKLASLSKFSCSLIDFGESNQKLTGFDARSLNVLRSCAVLSFGRGTLSTNF
ncbi:hypothetical protein BOX15_Mlig007620g1 [Macrostomum lignano]|uniref:Uncharacterized protein n=1 Tax=Macrostomum lignano TaxID=282301 RepID=A0A267H6A3_9PLAT|nr:hypothetical protein BOX15_Mlig007620g1 [Macrostomum lignano]